MFHRFFFCLCLAAAFISCKQDKADTAVADGLVSPQGVVYKHNDNAVRIALRAEPTTLNPLLAVDASTRYVREMIFQTLNSRDPETLESVPLLASVPDVEKEASGGVAYSFLIDEAAKWPNGMPVTAADVIFSLKVVLNPLVDAGQYRPYYEMVSGVVTSPNNERRVRIQTKRPYLLAEESLASLPVYPEYAYDPEGLLRGVSLATLTNPTAAQRLAEKGGPLKAFADRFNDPATGRDADKIVGSGPYQLTNWEDGQRVTLTKREDYWAADRSDPWLAAGPDEIVFNIIADNATMVNALRDEAVDVVVSMSVDQFKEVRDDEYLNERYEFETVQSLAYFGLLYNMNNPLFRDAKTRRALAHLTDVDAMIEQLLPGLAARVSGPVLPGKSYYNNDLKLIDYDPGKAAALLAEAGWSDTNGDGTLDKEINGTREEFRFDFMTPASPTSIAIATLFKDWLRDAGIDMNVSQQDRRAMGGALAKGNFAMAILGQGFNPTPDEFTQVWASTSVPPNGSNRSGFNNAEADRLIKEIKVTLDAKDRDPLYRRFQEIIYEEQPMIFLFSPLDRVVVSKRFEYAPKSTSPNLNFNDLTRKKWNRVKKGS